MNRAPRRPTVRLLLSRLTRSLETFRTHRKEVPLHMLMVFLIMPTIWVTSPSPGSSPLPRPKDWTLREMDAWQRPVSKGG